MVKVHFSFKMH